MSDQITVFDRATVRRHRDRAAAELGTFDFLFRESALRLADRLDDISRTFPVALDLGCHGGELAAALSPKPGIETLIQADLSPAMARRAGGRAVVMDEEFLPFAPGSLDAVLTNLSLHWVNDLPGTLLQLRHALKPDGLLLGAMLGGETLHELRHCLTQAEVETEGGLSPRVSPFADSPDVGALLQRAGLPCRLSIAKSSRSVTRTRSSCWPICAAWVKPTLSPSAAKASPAVRHSCAPCRFTSKRTEAMMAVCQRHSISSGCTLGRRTKANRSRYGPAAPPCGWPMRSTPKKSALASSRAATRVWGCNSQRLSSAAR